MSETKNKFISILELLNQVCYDGKSHYIIWKELMDAFSEEQNIYYDIEVSLVMTMNAHFEVSITRLFKLLDTHNDSININYFLNFIKSNTCILGYIGKNELIVELEKDRSFLNSQQEKIDRLKTLRDKYYSHLDKKYFNNYDELFKNHKVTYNEIEELFEELDKIITKYENYFYNFPEHIGGDVRRYDIKTLAAIIKKHFNKTLNK